jgi:hypothetical protein
MLGKQIASRVNVYSANSLAMKMDAVTFLHNTGELLQNYKAPYPSCRCKNLTHHSSVSFSHLHELLPSSIFISGFSTELLHPYLIPPACATHSAHLTVISTTIRMNLICYIRGPQTFLSQGPLTTWTFFGQHPHITQNIFEWNESQI